MASTRRTFAKNIVVATAAFSLPAFAKAGRGKEKKKLKIVCVGGHPDDPESGCGGTLALLAEQKHDVTIIYLTSGEAGIHGKSFAEAASIRTKEAIAACKILNAKPVFAGQVDSEGTVNNEWVKKIQALITNENPQIVFTHLPLDSHKDHQAASLLTIQSWIRTGKKFELYFLKFARVLKQWDLSLLIMLTSALPKNKKRMRCFATPAKTHRAFMLLQIVTMA